MSLSLLIVFVVDFLIFFQEPKKGSKFFQPISEWLILLLSESFYGFYFFFIPMFFAGFSLNEVLIAFFTIHAINGLMIGIVFQPSHYFQETSFFPDDRGYKDNWYLNQLMSTLDISPCSNLLNFFLGGLNANASHHLFPKISHVHYPVLSEVIRQVCEKYEMPYFRKNYSEALKSHISLLQKMSK